MAVVNSKIEIVLAGPNVILVYFLGGLHSDVRKGLCPKLSLPLAAVDGGIERMIKMVGMKSGDPYICFFKKIPLGDMGNTVAQRRVVHRRTIAAPGVGCWNGCMTRLMRSRTQYRYMVLNNLQCEVSGMSRSAFYAVAKFPRRFISGFGNLWYSSTLAVA